jgi:hypothetical protein
MLRGSSKGEVVEYRGHRYRRYPQAKSKTHQRYFYGTEPRRGFLHRHVWEDERGLIPKGYNIHHIDEDTTNNAIENLECITILEHRNKHPMVGESLARQVKHLASIRHKAAEWHRSEVGRQWHREKAAKQFARAH